MPPAPCLFWRTRFCLSSFPLSLARLVKKPNGFSLKQTAARPRSHQPSMSFRHDIDHRDILGTNSCFFFGRIYREREREARARGGFEGRRRRPCFTRRAYFVGGWWSVCGCYVHIRVHVHVRISAHRIACFFSFSCLLKRRAPRGAPTPPTTRRQRSKKNITVLLWLQFWRGAAHPAGAQIKGVHTPPAPWANGSEK